jgi:hypothetical protein
VLPQAAYILKFLNKKFNYRLYQPVRLKVSIDIVVIRCYITISGSLAGKSKNVIIKENKGEL